MTVIDYESGIRSNQFWENTKKNYHKILHQILQSNKGGLEIEEVKG